MAKRSYGQHCGLAVGLDVLAERWTLLVIRELLPGGRRFNELFEALPGVSTDLLTARLRSLEDAGVVERQALRHPAKVTLYQLTEWGDDLRPIVEQLAMWGVRLLPEPGHPDYRMNHRSALSAIAMAYDGDLELGEYVFTIDDEDLRITMTDAGARFHYGPPVGHVVVHLVGTTTDFYQWALASAAGAQHGDLGGDLKVGEPVLLARLMAHLPGPGLPVT